MKFLIACNHVRTILDADSAQEALSKCTCKKCVVFDRVNEKWAYRDVRVYRSIAQDAVALSSSMENISPQRKKDLASLDQTDWVTETGWRVAP